MPIGRLAVLCALIMLSPAALESQVSARAAERDLLRLEDEWAKALVRRDAGAFRRLILPEFVYTEDARVMTRDELIRESTAGTDTVTWAGNEDLKVLVRGATAVVTGSLLVRGKGREDTFDRRFRFTDTWVRTNGRWRVLAAQDYLVPR